MVRGLRCRLLRAFPYSHPPGGRRCCVARLPQAVNTLPLNHPQRCYQAAEFPTLLAACTTADTGRHCPAPEPPPDVPTSWRHSHPPGGVHNCSFRPATALPLNRHQQCRQAPLCTGLTLCLAVPREQLKNGPTLLPPILLHTPSHSFPLPLPHLDAAGSKLALYALHIGL